MKIINFPGSKRKTGEGAPTKEYISCELVDNKFVDPDVSRLSFLWQGSAPKAGQFFMIKPERTRVFLGRPISVAAWYESKQIIEFIIATRGTGTIDIVNMFPGECAYLTGPLGNSWSDFLSVCEENKKIALLGGGLGVAPLQALVDELADNTFDFYAGFKIGFLNDDSRYAMLGAAADLETDPKHRGSRLIIATEDGSEGAKGFITKFLDPGSYAAVYACGPQPMLKKVITLCTKANVPCFISMERHMACGTGACLGCSIRTIGGNRRCCTDGPIFPAEELYIDE